jgi:hypothetical protein
MLELLFSSLKLQYQLLALRSTKVTTQILHIYVINDFGSVIGIDGYNHDFQF